ncbi:MAG TPA: lipid-binding SYLF domain-containing protein [Bryobacteraceae bacterium]|nr:lipid-binding SYLF domain-containing protein [Bryobacteraceae bacterium]
MHTKLISGLILAASAAMAADSAAIVRLQAAADVFREIQKTPDNDVPDALLEKANGIIIVPGLKRAGFVFGGEYGKGVFLVRLPNGHWSPPSTVRIEGGSFGLQIGAGETDLIMLAMNQDAVRQLMRMGVKIGADVMAAAGPVGRSAAAATTPIPAAGLLAYSRARGIFAGATVNGTTMRSDDDDNAKIYGRKVDQSDILSGKVKAPAAAAPLMKELERYFRRNPSTEPPPARVK